MFRPRKNLSEHICTKDTRARYDFFGMKIHTTNNEEEKATLVENHGVHLKNAELSNKHYKR